MTTDPPIAAFGTVAVSQALVRKDISKVPETNKYHDLLQAVHDAAFPKGSPDAQSRLGWDNIEGEVMGIVLTQDLISGTALKQITHPFFHFATPQQCLENEFTAVLVERIAGNKYLVPSVTVLKENLNRLMISLDGKGRDELIQMLQSFQVSMQEQERKDPLQTALRRGGHL